ncbi:leucine aminopeptidase [Daedaleopsis nitida]|nr:leucine aminopeptidase [Daedaleopsis nitida]
MLSRAARLLLRSPSLLRRLSSIYVLPGDPKAPAATAAPVEAAKLWQTAPVSGSKPAKAGTTHLFYGDSITALSSLGDKFELKEGDERREIVRKAVASGIKKVLELGEGVEGSDILVDASQDPHAAAVGAHLALYHFTLKTKPTSPFDPRQDVPLPDKLSLDPLTLEPGWQTGVVYARAQNLARTVQLLRSTGSVFAARIKAEAAGLENVEVIVRDTEWAAKKGMRTFLSVAKGSQEPAKFLELHYNGGAKDAPPLVLVGKGVTFDSGGISLKPSSGMKLMRGDMGGAATVNAAALAVAKLQLPINLVVLTPLTENLPGPTAMKPGDIVYAMNGKSIEIDNTDAEGRLILSDAIYYGSTEFNAHTLIDVATLTGLSSRFLLNSAMSVALGEAYSGVFTNSDSLWSELDTAGRREYDRFWRMPLDEEYAPQITASNADLCNVGGKGAESCTAALFLKSFVEGVDPADGEALPRVRWAHIDIAGSMEALRG